MCDAGIPVPAGPYMLHRLLLTDSLAGAFNATVQRNELQAGSRELQVLCRLSARFVSTTLARQDVVQHCQQV